MPRKYQTSKKTTTTSGKNEYQKQYMQEYRRRKKEKDANRILNLFTDLKTRKDKKLIFLEKLLQEVNLIFSQNREKLQDVELSPELFDYLKNLENMKHDKI